MQLRASIMAIVLDEQQVASGFTNVIAKRLGLLAGVWYRAGGKTDTGRQERLDETRRGEGAKHGP